MHLFSVSLLCPWLDPSFSWEVNFKEFAHPAVTILSAVGTAGPTFFFAIAMFGFSFQINSLTLEKELKLRQVWTFFCEFWE